jgi:hypothetical protein
MVPGPHGASYLEVELLQLDGPGAYIGLARSWLDPSRK